MLQFSFFCGGYVRAVLCCAVPCCAVLCCAVPCRAVPCRACASLLRATQCDPFGRRWLVEPPLAPRRRRPCSAFFFFFGSIYRSAPGRVMLGWTYTRATTRQLPRVLATGSSDSASAHKRFAQHTHTGLYTPLWTVRGPSGENGPKSHLWGFC